MPKFKLETKVQAKDMFLSMNVSRVFSVQAELGSISDEQPLGKHDVLILNLNWHCPLSRNQQHHPQLCHRGDQGGDRGGRGHRDRVGLLQRLVRRGEGGDRGQTLHLRPGGHGAQHPPARGQSGQSTGVITSPLKSKLKQ